MPQWIFPLQLDGIVDQIMPHSPSTATLISKIMLHIKHLHTTQVVELNNITHLYIYIYYMNNDARDEIFRIWGVNTMPVDALAPEVDNESRGMWLAV